MSRSLHTRPREIRAADRLCAPYAPRRVADLRDRHRQGRLLKQSGIVAEPHACGRGDVPTAAIPRLHMQRPAPGLYHPASRAEIGRLLAHIGAECIYGVRGIGLVNPPETACGLRFGTLIVPGWIVLYAQLESPWTLPGRLPDAMTIRLQGAGATIELLGGGAQTVVSWPRETLRDFIRCDVLLHEIGHHVIQHNTGKRRERIMRTKDHGVAAEHIARLFHARYLAERAG